MKYLVLTSLLLVNSVIAEENLLLGNWCSHFDGDVCVGNEVFEANGVYKAFGEMKEVSVSYDSSGTWTYNDGEICIEPKERNFFNMLNGKRINRPDELNSFCYTAREINEKSMNIYLPWNEQEMEMTKIDN